MEKDNFIKKLNNTILKKDEDLLSKFKEIDEMKIMLNNYWKKEEHLYDQINMLRKELSIQEKTIRKYDKCNINHVNTTNVANDFGYTLFNLGKLTFIRQKLKLIYSNFKKISKSDIIL